MRRQELVSIERPRVQFSSVTQSCLTLCDPMNCSMPGLPVHHQLPESIQTHFHSVGDAIQPSHPLSSPSPPALNLAQHQENLLKKQLMKQKQIEHHEHFYKKLENIKKESGITEITHMRRNQ